MNPMCVCVCVYDFGRKENHIPNRSHMRFLLPRITRITVIIVYIFGKYGGNLIDFNIDDFFSTCLPLYAYIASARLYIYILMYVVCNICEICFLAPCEYALLWHFGLVYTLPHAVIYIYVHWRCDRKPHPPSAICYI